MAITSQLGPDPQEVLLHQFGSWGLIFLILTLAATPVNRLIKGYKILSYRRMLGLYFAFYALSHLLVYLQFFITWSLSELLTEISERPYITVGMLAIILTLPLVLTSNKKAMRALGKNWKALHKCVYLIAVLVITHYIWQSKSDLNEPLIYTLIVGWLLGIRLWWNYNQKVLQKRFV